MRAHRGLIAALVIAICSLVLAVSAVNAVLFFEQTHVSVPLILVAVVCAAIIAGTARSMRP